MTRRLPCSIFILAFTYFHGAQAKSFDSISFKSKHDRFVIVKKIDGFHYIGRKKVSLEPLQDFMDLITSEVEGSCEELPESPDLKLKATIEEKSGLGKNTHYKIEFFIPQKMLRKGSECAPISGDGIYYLPLHRSWFTGKTLLSITPNQSISISKDGQALLEVDRPHGEWRNASGGTGTNWEHFRNFMNSLDQFSVTARIHNSIGKGKSQAELVFDGKPYKAYLIGKNLWALQFPNLDWLVASKDWAVWGDLSPSDWYDRFTPTLKKVMDKSLTVEMRQAAMQKLGSKWSKSIKRTFQAVLEDKDEPADLRIEAVKRLRKKPSDDNFVVFIEALDPKENPELLFQLTRALRVKNPSGPSIEPGTPIGEVENSIIVWQSWWDQIEKSRK